MSTFLDIASDSLTEIGQLGVGQSISPEQSQQALRLGNRMLQKWSLQRFMLPLVNSRPFVLAAGTQDYTVGPTGGFASNRPVFVEAAQIAAPGSSLYLPLNILDTSKWGAIRDKGATCSAAGLPQDVWPEYTYPNLSFHIWTIPSNGATILLKTWELLQQFVSVFDVLNFPPGYEEAIMHNLAMELSPFYDQPISSALQQLAADGLLRIQGLNAQSFGGALGESQTLQTPNLATPLPTGGGGQ